MYLRAAIHTCVYISKNVVLKSHKTSEGKKKTPKKQKNKQKLTTVTYQPKSAVYVSKSGKIHKDLYSDRHDTLIIYNSAVPKALPSTVGSTLYLLPSTIKLRYPVVSSVPSLTCFYVPWFPHTAVRVYLLPWDLPSTLYYQLTVSGGEFSALSNLLLCVLVPPTLQLGSTLYRGIYPLPSTLYYQLTVSGGEFSALSNLFLCVLVPPHCS